jgi:hypothetical protein
VLDHAGEKSTAAENKGVHLHRLAPPHDQDAACDGGDQADRDQRRDQRPQLEHQYPMDYPYEPNLILHDGKHGVRFLTSS